MSVLFDLLLVHDFLLDLLELLFIVAIEHLGSSDKNIFNTLSTLGRCFKVKMNALFLLKSSSLLIRHSSLSFKIFFSTYEEHKHVFISILLKHLFLPLTHVVEGIRIRNIEAEKDAVCSSVEDFGDGFETLLSRCVPDLHLEDAFVDLEQDCAEFYSYCDFMVFLELISCHTMHKASFSDSRITDNNQFEQEILVRYRLIR